MNISKTISILLLSAILLIPHASTGKNGHFLGFYDKYEGQGNFTALSLKPGIIRLFTGGEDKDLRQLLKSIDNIKMLVYDGSPEQVSRYTDELKENFLADWYDDLLVINDGHDNVTFKTHMNGKKINELIMIVKEPGELAVFYAAGDIDLNKVKELSRAVSVNGLKNLNKLSSSDKDDE